MTAVLLALAVWLARGDGRARPEATARAVAAGAGAAGASFEDAALLLAVSWAETGLGRGGVPFGACGHLCARHCGRCRAGEPLADTARWALAVLARGRARCGGSVRGALRYYRAGSCRGVGAYDRRVEGTWRRMLREAAAHPERYVMASVAP